MPDATTDPAADFARELEERLGAPSVAEGFDRALRGVRQIAGGLKQYINRGLRTSEVRVSPRTRFRTRLGTAVDVQVGVGDRNDAATLSGPQALFRVYIPDDGTPLWLDLFGDEPVRCESVEELRGRVLEFLALPEVRGQLATLRELGEHPDDPADPRPSE